MIWYRCLTSTVCTSHLGFSLEVVLGANNAAQLHAEASLQGCYSSHWGSNGLKPYMQYSLAGGYQSNGENGSGSDYCIKAKLKPR